MNLNTFVGTNVSVAPSIKTIKYAKLAPNVCSDLLFLFFILLILYLSSCTAACVGFYIFVKVRYWKQNCFEIDSETDVFWCALIHNISNIHAAVRHGRPRILINGARSVSSANGVETAEQMAGFWLIPEFKGLTLRSHHMAWRWERFSWWRLDNSMVVWGYNIALYPLSSSALLARSDILELSERFSSFLCVTITTWIFSVIKVI